MRMPSLFRPLLLLFFFFGASSSFADSVSPDYYYKSRYGDFQDASLDRLCKKYYPDDPGNGVYGYRDQKWQAQSGMYPYACLAEYYNLSTGVTQSNNSADIRIIGTCSPPYTLDPVSKMCTNCPSTVGQSKEFRGPNSPVSFVDGASYVMWGPNSDLNSCFDSCEYSGSSITSCYFLSGSTDTGFCNYLTSGNGYACFSEDSPGAASGDPLDSIDPTDPTDPTDPGGGDPGGGDTGGGDTGGGDTGGGDTGGGDTGGGDTGGGDTGGGDTGGGDTGGTSAASGDACDQSLSCSGDAIQCAILRVQKREQCADADFRDMSAEKVADMRGELDSEFSGDEYQPIEPTAESTFDLSDSFDTSSRFTASCPVVADIQFTWINGSTQSIPIGSVFTDLCPYLQWFGYFVVAFAMRRAAEIVAQGMV